MRYAKAGQTIEDLKAKIDAYEGGIYDAAYGERTQQVRDDLSKVNVDGENVDFAKEYELPGAEDLDEFEMLNGIPIAWGSMGGDWEMPLVFVMYIGDKGELRAYIPEDGNAYCKAEKCAWGSNENDDDFIEERDYVFDSEKLRNDVMHRIGIKQS